MPFRPRVGASSWIKSSRSSNPNRGSAPLIGARPALCPTCAARTASAGSQRQLQQRYRFSNAAVDRYPLNQDSDSAQQVILSARELDQSALPRRSKTAEPSFHLHPWLRFPWNPVNERSSDGLPSYFISGLGTETQIEGNEALGIERSAVRQQSCRRCSALLRDAPSPCGAPTPSGI